MLNLHSATSPDWLPRVQDRLDEVLLDHAHCEKKAAGTAMNLMFAYPDSEEFSREMAAIVVEELDHFHQVLDVMQRRGMKYKRQKPSQYGGRLHALIRGSGPQRAVDRLLVAGLIEARSCERFDLLRHGIRDADLAAFYDRLFESEARHHATYVRLAKHFAPEAEVHDRLEELATEEARIIALGDDVVRMHS